MVRLENIVDKSGFSGSRREGNMPAFKTYSKGLLLILGILTVVYLSTKKDVTTNTESTAVKLPNTDIKSTVVESEVPVQRIRVDLLTAPKDLLEHFSYESKRKEYEINVTRSLEVPIARILPSTVPKECSTQQYLSRPLTVSIIIPFHAEHWTILLRVLHCVHNTVSNSLLHQVILVDDANDEPNLEAPFEQYLKNFPKVVLIRLKERHGLIKARMEGARAATGDVLVFVDAHVEMEAGWLEPLLQVISRDDKTVAVPRAHALNLNTLEPITPTTPRIDYGSFSWELDYFWMQMPDDVMKSRTSSIEPIPTATMIGCAFAVHRAQFFRLGGFDEGMEVWGGENLELSFRTWMCGGRVVLVPCSVTYHMYRAHLPYYLSTATMYKNLQRVAVTWMDDYQRHYFHSVGKVIPFTPEEQRSLAERRKLRQRLQCHNFTWYLQTIAPNILEPPRLAILWGQLKNLRLDACMSSHRPSFIGLNACPIYQPSQTFYYNTESELVHQESGLCLTNQRGTILSFEKCKLFEGSQTWSYNPLYPSSLSPYIIGVDVRKPIGSFWLQALDGERQCLDIAQNGKSKLWYPLLWKCDAGRLEQYWVFTHKINDHVYQGDAFENVL